jgi:hypothetical protein
MAKLKGQSSTTYHPKKKRPGVHAKSKTSKSKNSKKDVKKYVAHGR